MNTFNRFGNPLPKNVVILRALQLGDMLCAVPALRALRAALPEAHISLIGLPWAGQLVKRFTHYLDDLIEFPGFPGLPEQTPQLRKIPAFLEEVQSRQYDLAIQMHGAGNLTNPLVELFGARQVAGYFDPSYYCPDGEFLQYPHDEPEVWRHLRLMQFLGAPPQGDQLEFPLLPEDWEEFHQIETEHGLTRGRYAVIHAGSRKADRRWSIDRFAALADELAGHGLDIVLTGSSEEITLNKALAVQMNSHSLNLAGKTSLGALGALLSAARLLVCNDTGVSHLADALNVPSVVLFTAPDANRWAPKDKDLHRVLTQAATVEPLAVMHEVQGLLREERIHAYS